MGRIFNLDSPLMAGLSKLADLIWLNILAFICCIPIFTIGASLTALNYVALKMVRNQDGYVTRDFFKSFKQNFKQATIIWLIMVLIFVVIIGDLFIFNFSTLAFPAWLRIALGVVGILVVFATMLVFPVLARFDNTVKNTFRNSLFMAVLALPKTVLMIVIWAIPTAVTIFIPQAIPFVLAFGISGPVFLCAMLYNKTFKRFEPEEETASDEDWFIEPVDGEIEDGSEEAAGPDQGMITENQDVEMENKGEEEQ